MPEPGSTPIAPWIKAASVLPEPRMENSKYEVPVFSAGRLRMSP